VEVQIPSLVYEKIMHWIDKTDIEVSGFGKCTYHESGILEVHDVYLLEQEGGAAHTDIDSKALGKLMFQTKDKPGELRFWWHSHVNMQVFWSGTDTQTIKDMAKNGWIAATVFNKKREMRSAIGYVTNSFFGDSVHIEDNLPTYILSSTSPDLKKAWDFEFDSNVKEKKFAPNIIMGSEYATKQEDWPGLEAWWREDQYHTKEANKPKTDKWENDPGFFGYGHLEEARAAKLSPENYWRIMNSKDYKRIEEVEIAIDTQIRLGHLKELPDDYG
jgi:hypothetical protein